MEKSFIKASEFESEIMCWCEYPTNIRKQKLYLKSYEFHCYFFYFHVISLHKKDAFC